MQYKCPAGSHNVITWVRSSLLLHPPQLPQLPQLPLLRPLLDGRCRSKAPRCLLLLPPSHPGLLLCLHLPTEARASPPPLFPHRSYSFTARGGSWMQRLSYYLEQKGFSICFVLSVCLFVCLSSVPFLSLCLSRSYIYMYTSWILFE